MIKNQKGIALLETLLILLILTIIGFGGYYVWNSQKQTDKSLSSAEKASQTTSTAKSSAQKYLTIKEWGVKIKLSSTDSGAYYKVDEQTPRDSFGTPNNFEVFSTETDAIKGPLGIYCKGEYIASLLRLPADDDEWNDPLTSGYYPDPVQIGSHKFGVGTVKQYGPACWQAKDSTKDNYVLDNVTQDAFKSIANQFVQDFKSIQIQ
jgi:type II secretory pathway pseudopilin PulG